MSPPLALLWKPLWLLEVAREGGGTWKGPGDRGYFKIHELFDEFSLLGELEEEEEEEDDEKFIPVSPGGFVAVFCPLKLFRQTGHVSCFGEQTKKQNKKYGKRD